MKQAWPIILIATSLLLGCSNNSSSDTTNLSSDDVSERNEVLQASSGEAVQSPRFAGVIDADAALAPEAGIARNSKYELEWDEQ